MSKSPKKSAEDDMLVSQNRTRGGLDALNRVLLDLIDRHDLDEILDRLLVQGAELLEAPSVSIDLLEGDDTLVTHAATPGQPLQVGDRMRRGEGGHLSWQAIDTLQPAVLEDYSRWTKRRELYDNFPIHAILIIPIIHRGRAVGAINFLRFVENLTFSAADIYLAGQLALAVALILDNAQVYARLKSEIEEHKRTAATLLETQALMVEKEQVMAAMKERENLGRDLHDGVGQMLAYFTMQFDVLRDTLLKNDPQAALKLLEKLAEAARQTNQNIREYILGLKQSSTPLPTADFASVLQQYCTHLWNDYQFEVDLQLPSFLPDVVASPEVESQLIHIVFEALQNARKHSGVQKARLMIEVNDQLVQAIVEDRGRGINGGTEGGPGMHFGLGIMQSRAEEVGGSLQIETSPASGTRILVRLPRRLEELTISHLRILLADDHPLFIDGIRSILLQRGAQVIGIARDGVEAVEMAQALKPDLLVMDINMPRMNGIEATRLLKAELPAVKVIMMTTSMEEGDLFAALQAGAVGYLLKGMGSDEFMTLLGEIVNGGTTFSSDMAAKMLEIFARPDLRPSPTQPRDQLETLTERQRDVLSLVAQGLTYKEVGHKLFLTERTVKFHMGEILKRLQVKGRRELIELARHKRSQPGST